MFERFCDDARAAVVRAQTEARALGHGWIGTEHLVLGAHAVAGLDPGELRVEVRRASASGDGLDGRALATLGIDLDAVRDRVEAAFGPGALAGGRPTAGRLLFTAQAKKALELALREAVSLGSREIRAEHLLLGILRAGDGLGARLLAAHGVTADALRARVRGSDAA